ncbi:MAG: methyltransferase domain-containing protein [Ramlibacter sp.]|nr:methyltransferase domain-containing protein [Ramlibacter sp.]
MDGNEIVLRHSEHAGPYRHRLPYLPAFFEKLGRLLPIEPGAMLLDLCCGTGELAAGFASAGTRVTGLEAAPGMIAAARQVPGAGYLLHDVNGPSAPGALSGHRFDHIVIGRAVPYITDGALRLYVQEHLRGGGSVIICGSGLDPRVPWAADFARLRGAYAPVRGDFIGARKLAACGLTCCDKVVSQAGMSCDTNWLLRHALSFALSHDAIEADLDAFSARMTELTRPHLREGKLRGSVMSWALVYRAVEFTPAAQQKAASLLNSGPYPL